MEIIKLINAKNEASLKDASFTLPVSWDWLIPSIEKAVMLRNDEVIDGLIISEDSIEVKVSRKKGRKTTASELFNLNGGSE